MEDILDTIAASDLAQWLRQSRWGYAAVNTTHVFGLALLVGAILPLDLRLMGAWRAIDHARLVGVLAPCAGLGLALAVGSGVLLFSVRASEYASNPALIAKLLLVTVGVSSALFHHLRHGARLESAGPRSLFTAGAISMLSWTGALVAGRSIAFVGD